MRPFPSRPVLGGTALGLRGTLPFRLAACIIVGLAVLALNGRPATADQQKPMAEILPKNPHDTACFRAALPQPVAMDIEDWSNRRIKMEPVPGKFEKNGKQMTRPVPALLKGRKVTSLAVQISAENLNPSEPFGFIMRAKIKGWKQPIYAAGICIYPKDDAGKADAKRLGCYIECDGGGFGVRREPGTMSIAVRFDRDGLRMSPGCSEDEDPSYRVKSAAETQEFKLTPVAARQCRPLRAWLKKQQ